jgi:hypothetical protein
MGDSVYEDSFGDMGHGPGPEDFANGAALLVVMLAKHAGELASAAHSISVVVQHVPPDLTPPGPTARQALSQSTTSASQRAAAILALADLVSLSAGDASCRLQVGQGWLGEASILELKRFGTSLDALALAVRAAALQLTTDDGGARIAASVLASQIANLLNRYARVV